MTNSFALPRSERVSGRRPEGVAGPVPGARGGALRPEPAGGLDRGQGSGRQRPGGRNRKGSRRFREWSWAPPEVEGTCSAGVHATADDAFASAALVGARELCRLAEGGLGLLLGEMAPATSPPAVKAARLSLSEKPAPAGTVAQAATSARTVARARVARSRPPPAAMTACSALAGTGRGAGIWGLADDRCVPTPGRARRAREQGYGCLRGAYRFRRWSWCPGR